MRWLRRREQPTKRVCNRCNVYTKLIYLDSEYITRLYEAITDDTPPTSITTANEFKGGANLPFLGVSTGSIETRSYAKSTFAIFTEILQELLEFPSFDPGSHGTNTVSKLAWIKRGCLTVSTVEVKRRTREVRFYDPALPQVPERQSHQSETTSETTVAKDGYFVIEDFEYKSRFALITSASNFLSGIEVFTRLVDTCADQIAIPVTALLRVFSAIEAFGGWIASPVVIIEGTYDDLQRISDSEGKS